MIKQMCSNVTHCHCLRWIINHSVLIVKEEKEHIASQREKEKSEKGRDNSNTIHYMFVCFNGI